MSVSDLHSRDFFGRTSLFLFGDRLIRLDHGRSKDRVRTYLYEGIESVLIWRRLRWPAALTVAVILGAPAIIFFSIAGNAPRDEFPAGYIIGAVLLAMAIVWAAWTLYCPAVTVRFVRAGKTNDLQGSFRPVKFKKFRDALLVEIAQAQKAAMERRAAAPSTAEQPRESEEAS